MAAEAKDEGRGAGGGRVVNQINGKRRTRTIKEEVQGRTRRDEELTLKRIIFKAEKTVIFNN